MNKFVYLVILSALFFHSSLAQKPLIGWNGETWNSYGVYSISNNGEYIVYDTYISGRRNLFIRSIQSERQIMVPGMGLFALSQDSKKVIMITQLGDTLGIMELNEPNRVVYLKDIQNFRVVKRGHDFDLLIYRVKEHPHNLVIRDIESGEEKSYLGVENYWTSDDGNAIVLEMTEKDSSAAKYVLNWLDLSKNELRPMWEGQKVEDLTIGHNDIQCVFMASTATGTGGSGIWVYQNRNENAIKVLDAQSEMLEGMTIEDVIAFNDVSGRIFIDLGEPKTIKKAQDGVVSVDIWSYKDVRLQSEQLAILKNQQGRIIKYKAVLNLATKELIRLEYEHDGVSSEFYNDKALHFVLLFKNEGCDEYAEWNWNSACHVSVYLVDLNTGKRRLITEDVPAISLDNCILSYNENYIFYYDPAAKGYWSYKVSNGARRNLTVGVGGFWGKEETADQPDGSYEPYIIAGLIRNEDAILVYDQHDLFKLNPASHTPAVNLTGLARGSHEWQFRLLGHGPYDIIDSNETLCLSVLNKINKEAALCWTSIGSKSSVPSLNFEPYWFDSKPYGKARDKNAFIVERQSAEESPNLFFTTDFKKYTPLTDFHPERAYNWIKTELVTWKTFDGGLSQGILYKPENFDPKRKYPLLVFYYERCSDGLHHFIGPGKSDGSLNIPYYVSHGYLVFTPDVHYKVGWPGRSAYNCIVSGVEFLMKRSYVDSKRMGLQGHSFGGFETNYIITHSTLFAAAMSASGMTDFVSAYGSVIGDGSSRQRAYELYRDRIGATLSDRPNLYIENSPVLRANKVTTPLLMMTNYADGDVPCQQGIEFFTGLRRAGKKTWMLQYDSEGHNLDGDGAQSDLTLRMAQFFNYYLKGELPPRWMTVGVPANLKRIDSGLEIDSSGIKP